LPLLLLSTTTAAVIVAVMFTAALAVVFGQGVWFEAAHAIGNVVIALAIGPELRRLLERYARRLRTEVVWEQPQGLWE